MVFAIGSPCFKSGGFIPRRHTCDGEDVSPALRWHDVPSGTKSLALICDDPDAPFGTWTHWLIYSIPPTIIELKEAMPRNELVEGGIKQGRNSWNKTGYAGPCPPGNASHRYFFRIYALDTYINLRPEFDRKELEKAMKTHILAQAETMGVYARQ